MSPSFRETMYNAIHLYVHIFHHAQILTFTDFKCEECGKKCQLEWLVSRHRDDKRWSKAKAALSCQFESDARPFFGHLLCHSASLSTQCVFLHTVRQYFQINLNYVLVQSKPVYFHSICSYGIDMTRKLKV